MTTDYSNAKKKQGFLPHFMANYHKFTALMDYSNVKATIAKQT